MLSLLRNLSLRLLPSACALCGEDSDEAVCSRCNERYLSVRPARCACCAIVLDDPAGRCGSCLASPPAFDRTVTVADYAPPVDQLAMALKFGARLALAPQFARLLHEALVRDAAEAPDLLVAVPLGAKRLAQRGFNQALEMAKPLSRRSGIALEKTLLMRLRDTDAQSLLHPDQRRRNVRGAFGVAAGSAGKLAGRHVGVVDDVITTGETLNEVAATLKRFGATRVTNIVFARTPPK